jgi:hypothetical protein
MIGGKKVARSTPMLGAPQTFRLALPGPRRDRQSARRSRFIVTSIFAAVAAASIGDKDGLASRCARTTTHADGMADAGRLWPVVVCDRAHRYGGDHYRLVGFDIPERDDLAHCDYERQFPARATARLIELLATRLTRVAFVCRPAPKAPGATISAAPSCILIWLSLI